MPNDSIEEITERMSRALSMGRGSGNVSAGSSANSAGGFTQAQKDEIRTIVSSFFTQDNLDEDRDHPVGIVKLEELDKIPDIVKSIREFSGKPGEFGSWRKSVDRVLELFEGVKGTSRYYAILHTIRTKIVGEADTALDSYRTPLDWVKIRKCLMMHYSDKRDIGTLEYQMTTLCQGSRTITEFYQAVYQHLSLILDKVACLDLDSSSLGAMTNAYREKALDTFIRGLRGDLPRLLSVREPTSLPQALHMCLKLDNMSYRMNHANAQIPRMGTQKYQTPQLGARPKFYPELAHLGGLPRPPLPPRVIQRPAFGSFHQNNFKPQPHFNFDQNRSPGINMTGRFFPPVTSHNSRGPVPMEVDSSLQSKQVNYINRPAFNPAYKRPSGSFQGPAQKVQRNFHVKTESSREQNDEVSPSLSYEDSFEKPSNINECFSDVNEYFEDLSQIHELQAEESDNAPGAYSTENFNNNLDFFG